MIYEYLFQTKENVKRRPKPLKAYTDTKYDCLHREAFAHKSANKVFRNYNLQI